MNIFRLIADSLHLVAIIILIHWIIKARNVIGKSKWFIGLSYKTQECFLIAFCCRYLDLFMYFVSLYNTSMKIIYISATVLTIYLIRFKFPFCNVSPLTPRLMIKRSMTQGITEYTFSVRWPLLSCIPSFRVSQLYHSVWDDLVI